MEKKAKIYQFRIKKFLPITTVNFYECVKFPKTTNNIINIQF